MRKQIYNPSNIFHFMGSIFAGIGILFTIIGVLFGVSPATGKSTYPDMFPFLLTFGGAGILFLIIGIVLIVIAQKQKHKAARLKETGERLFSSVTGGMPDYTIRINQRYPYRLECRYDDPFSKETYLFRSGPIWQDPNLYIGQQITVYADRTDRSNYYVDTETLERCCISVHDYR